MRAKKKVEEPKAEQPEQPALRLEWRTPQELVENPRNWRTHPAGQTKALQGVMQEVGWAGALLYNEASGKMLDGHARKKITRPGEKVPVLIGSWTEAQEKLILATLDPIGALAQKDSAALVNLMESMEAESEALDRVIDELRAGAQLEVTILGHLSAATPEASASPRSMGDKKKQIKAVLYVDEIGPFEQAIAATGKKNRGEAILEVCNSYLGRPSAEG